MLSGDGVQQQWHESIVISSFLEKNIKSDDVIEIIAELEKLYIRNYYEISLLRYDKKMKLDEISIEMGISKGVIQRRLQEVHIAIYIYLFLIK